MSGINLNGPATPEQLTQAVSVLIGRVEALEDAAPQAPASATSPTFHVCYPTHPTQLYRELTLLQELCVDVVVEQPTRVQISGQIEAVHRDLVNGAQFPVGIAARIGWRRVDLTASLPAMPGTRAPTQTYPQPGNWIKGAKSGQNINGYDDHYGRLLLASPPFVLTTPGKYRIEVWATSHTDYSGAANFDGNACIHVPAGDPVAAAADPYGFMCVEVAPL